MGTPPSSPSTPEMSAQKLSEPVYAILMSMSVNTGRGGGGGAPASAALRSRRSLRRCSSLLPEVWNMGERCTNCSWQVRTSGSECQLVHQSSERDPRDGRGGEM